MTPILCIGELKEEFELNVCRETCTVQLAKCLADIPAEEVKKIVIAYEPVWAIGTGLIIIIIIIVIIIIIIIIVIIIIIIIIIIFIIIIIIIIVLVVVIVIVIIVIVIFIIFRWSNCL